MEQSSPPLDWSLSLRLLGQQPTIAKEILEMFVAQLPTVQQQLQEQLLQQNTSKIRDLIHQLHGACSYTGAPQLKKFCHSLESEADSLSWDEVQSRVQEILESIDQTIKYFAEHHEKFS